MGNRTGNKWDLERTGISYQEQHRSITITNTDLKQKSEPDAPTQSWLGGFLKSDGTTVRLFVRPASRF